MAPTQKADRPKQTKSHFDFQPKFLLNGFGFRVLRFANNLPNKLAAGCLASSLAHSNFWAVSKCKRDGKIVAMTTKVQGLRIVHVFVIVWVQAIRYSVRVQGVSSIQPNLNCWQYHHFCTYSGCCMVQRTMQRVHDDTFSSTCKHVSLLLLCPNQCFSFC